MNMDQLKGFTMKQTILASVLVLAACSPSGPSAETKEACAVIGGYAEMIMRERQNGGDMATTMQRATNPASQIIVESAYAEPLYSTEAAQTRAVQEFKNRMYASCLRGE